MREFTFKMPLNDNNDLPMVKLHNRYKAQLCALFGGLSVTLGHGMWVNEDNKLFDEEVATYTIACEADKLDLAQTLAEDFGRAAKQEAIYINRDGKVSIYDIKPDETFLGWQRNHDADLKIA